MKYLIDLQELRGLSVTFVVLFHYNFIKRGYLGVDIFILISGFLIYEQYRKSTSLSIFYINRIKRIILLSYLIEFITLFYFSRYYKNTIPNIIDEYNNGLIFTSNIYYYYSGIDYFSSTVRKVFLHYWYISMDLHFFFIYPLLHKLNLYFITVFYLIYLYIDIKNSELSYYIVLTRIYEYMLGNAAYLYRKYSNRFLKIISYFILLYFVIKPFKNNYLNNSIILLFTVMYLMNNSKCIGSYFIETLGNISYILYLVHYPLSVINESFLILLYIIPFCIIINTIEIKILSCLKRLKILHIMIYIILYYILCRSYSNIVSKNEKNKSVQEIPESKQNNCCDYSKYNEHDILIIGDSHAYRFLTNIVMKISTNNNNIYWKYVNSKWIVRNSSKFIYNINENAYLIISMNMMSRRKFGIYPNISLFFVNYINYLKTKCTYLIVYKPTPIFNFSVDCMNQIKKKVAIIGYNISLYPLKLDIKYTTNLILKDLSKYYCKNKICKLIFRNKCIYNDYNHLNPSFLVDISNNVKDEISKYFPSKNLNNNNTCKSFIIYKNIIPYNWMFLKNKCIKSFFTKLDIK